ncbi:MAG: dihydropteroate synthase [Prevotella sp.]|nr:dihydropteroate synthase [Prevotella sp.]
MNNTINIRGGLLDLGKPCVMGILNVTPDSFYQESRKQTERDIAERTHQIIAEGGTMIDVGACSTRPGATPVDKDEELRRLAFALPIIRREQPDAIVSVDTFRPEVAQQCVEQWDVDIINDVEGSEEMWQMVASLHTPYIYMSSRPSLHDILIEFADVTQRLHGLGIKDIIIDPGFGFGKTMEQNYRILSEMEKLQVLGLPILVGVSRKRMVYQLLGNTPKEALNGTTVLHAIALQKGASILRVHDVREAAETILIMNQLCTMNS